MPRSTNSARSGGRYGGGFGYANAATAESPEVAFFDSKASLDDHMRIIQRQVKRSLADPETVQLARRIVSGRYDYVRDPATGKQVAVVKAWGSHYRAPPGRACAPRDAACEIRKIWDFVVLNLRYTFDPQDPDTFSTVKESLDAGGGDCDDSTVMFAALLKAIGFSVVARVISTDGSKWEHVFAIVGCSHDNPTKWCPLDPTVDGVQLGWMFPNPRASRDFPM